MNVRTLFLLLSLILSTCASAQTVPDRAKERAKNRAENKANNKLDQKVDKAVDDTFSAIEGLFKKRKKKNKKDGEATQGTTTDRNQSATETDEDQISRALGGLFGGGDSNFEPYTNPTSFSLEMHISTTKRNGKQEAIQMTIVVAPTLVGQKFEATEKGKTTTTRTIFDTQDGKTTMVSTDGKGEASAVRLRTPNFSKAITGADPEGYMENISFEETGVTKVIEGYNCSQILVTDTKEGTTSESWVTDETGIKNEELYNAMLSFAGGGKQNFPTAPPGLENSFPIMTTTTTKKGEVMVMTYKNIKTGEANIDKSVLDLSGIEVTEVPGL